MIIDFHSHVIPGIDDGARDVGTAVEMLRRSAEQGVQLMVATSHFYASRDHVDQFLEKRQTAYEALRAAWVSGLPDIVLGAEVAYFPGIARAERLDALKIQGTSAMLVEMPFGDWTRAIVDDVEALIEKRHVRVILAHLERYLAFPGNRDFIERLSGMPLAVQNNAESLTDWRQRGKLLRMFKNGKAHLLGSDCHSLNRRPPNLGEGREVLRKRLGEDFLERMDRFGEGMLKE